MSKRKLLVEVECGEFTCQSDGGSDCTNLSYSEARGLGWCSFFCMDVHGSRRHTRRSVKCLEAERAAQAADNAAYWQKKYEDLEVRRASCCEATELEAKSLAAQLDGLVRAARRVVEAASWCRDEFPGAGSMFPLIDALDAIDRAAKAKDGE